MKPTSTPASASNASMLRETFSSRFGFLMLSAACAIGLGNVWRFPYITGKYGGGIFVLVYLVFLLAVLPVMIMEFAIGRASRASLGTGLSILEPKGSKWHLFRALSLVGPYALLMFYCTVTGWTLAYTFFMAKGTLASCSAQEMAPFFSSVLASPSLQICYTIVCVALCAGVAALGLRRGVERVIKFMMIGLFLLITLLVIRVLFLPGALKGLAYFLLPDLDRFASANFLDLCNAAMCQAFFTLGIGIGCMVTIGSYYTKEKNLAGEAVWIAVLDTVVALLAGILIFPACFSFAIAPDSGPGLLFITLPNVFNSMSSGQLWGALFFLFMSFASLSTVIAVFETIVSYGQDVFGQSRVKASCIHGFLLIVLSLPCALGWSVFADVQPFGPGSTILDLEDFIVSNNLLPLGALFITLFCSLKCGWGWENCMREVNQGAGMRIPAWFRVYLRWVLPVVLLIIFCAGYVHRFG